MVRTEMHNKARWGPVIIVIALVVAASTSCTTQNSGGQSSSTKLVVLGAASLAKVFPSIGSDFADANPGVSFQFSFAGTDTIAAQIEQGAKADVFAGASTSYGDQLQSDGLIDPYKPFATNQLVLVLPPVESGAHHVTGGPDAIGESACRGRADRAGGRLHAEGAGRNLNAVYGQHIRSRCRRTS